MPSARSSTLLACAAAALGAAGCPRPPSRQATAGPAPIAYAAPPRPPPAAAATTGAPTEAPRPALASRVPAVGRERAVGPDRPFADLDPARCYAELDRAGVRWHPAPEAAGRGVLAPIRLDGPVGGVWFHTELPEKQRGTSPFEVIDCRLALTLHAWSAILRAHGIDEVTMFSAWRPPPKRWPAGREADRHPGAVAIDVRRLRADGRWIVVETDFHGKIGHRVCGPDATPPTADVPEARELRAIVCETADAHLFNTILTPDHDRRHFNHLHLDIRPRTSWRMVE